MSSGIFALIWGAAALTDRVPISHMKIFYFLENGPGNWFWGSTAILIGFLQIWADVNNNRKARVAASMLMIGLCGGMALGIRSDATSAVSWAAYLGWAVHNALIILRI
jgi:hypothetical protein